MAAAAGGEVIHAPRKEAAVGNWRANALLPDEIGKRRGTFPDGSLEVLPQEADRNTTASRNVLFPLALGPTNT